jgi:hypothetical protein
MQRELTAIGSHLDTPHPVGHRHYRHNHLCHDHNVPHTIRESGNTGRRAEYIFHMLYVLNMRLRWSGSDYGPPVAVCSAFSVGEILPLRSTIPQSF